MVKAMMVAIIALAGLAGLMAVRDYLARERGDDYPMPPLLFGLWLVSTVVWNTFYFSARIPGLFDFSIERLLFIGLVFSCLFRISRRKFAVRGSFALELWFAAFLILCILSMSINGFEALYPVYPKPWYLFFSAYFVPFVAMIYSKHFLHDGRAVRFIMGTLFVLGVYLCLTAIMERTALRPYVLPSYILTPEVTLHLDRARGPFLNAAYNGLAMTIGFICGIYLLPRARGGKKFFMVLMLLLFFPGVFLTYTRSAYLSFAFVILTLVFVYRTRMSKWKLIPVFIALVAIAGVANVNRLLSADRAKGGIAQMREVEIRFLLINRSMHLIATHPFFGVGLGHFTVAESRPEVFQDQQHNHLIGLAVELGLAGVSCYIGLLIHIFRRLYKMAKDPRNFTIERANQVIMLACAFFANLLTNIFIEPSYCQFINVNTFVLAGIIDRFAAQPELFEGPMA